MQSAQLRYYQARQMNTYNVLRPGHHDRCDMNRLLMAFPVPPPALVAMTAQHPPQYLEPLVPSPLPPAPWCQVYRHRTVAQPIPVKPLVSDHLLQLLPQALVLQHTLDPTFSQQVVKHAHWPEGLTAGIKGSRAAILSHTASCHPETSLLQHGLKSTHSMFSSNCSIVSMVQLPQAHNNPYGCKCSMGPLASPGVHDDGTVMIRCMPYLLIMKTCRVSAICPPCGDLATLQQRSLLLCGCYYVVAGVTA